MEQKTTKLKDRTEKWKDRKLFCSSFSVLLLFMLLPQTGEHTEAEARRRQKNPSRSLYNKLAFFFLLLCAYHHLHAYLCCVPFQTSPRALSQDRASCSRPSSPSSFPNK